MKSDPPVDGDWRRQSARFAAIASGFIGIGVLIILLMVWRDGRPTPPPSAKPTPAVRE